MKFTASTFSLHFTPPEAHQFCTTKFGHDRFRRVLAAAMGNGPSLDHVRREIFWLQAPGIGTAEAGARFDAESWVGRPGRPRYVTETRGGHGVITAFGDEANDLLVRHADAIQEALHVHWGQRPVMRVREQPMTLDLYSEETTLYQVRHFCMKDRSAQRAGFWRQFTREDSNESTELTDRAALRRIERRILLDIQEQCDILGWRLPAESMPRIFALEARRLTPVAARAHKLFPRCSVMFQSTARMTGEWHLGSLISRGYGWMQCDAPVGNYHATRRWVPNGRTRASQVQAA